MFNQITRLDIFYLTGGLILVAVAIVYWADAIREKSDKSKKKHKKVAKKERCGVLFRQKRSSHGMRKL